MRTLLLCFCLWTVIASAEVRNPLILGVTAISAVGFRLVAYPYIEEYVHNLTAQTSEVVTKAVSLYGASIIFGLVSGPALAALESEFGYGLAEYVKGGMFIYSLVHLLAGLSRGAYDLMATAEVDDYLKKAAKSAFWGGVLGLAAVVDPPAWPAERFESPLMQFRHYASRATAGVFSVLVLWDLVQGFFTIKNTE